MMSRAFVKEDVDPPERSGRKRSAGGLPPGAVNYITQRGAQRLQEELRQLRQSCADPERIAALETTIASITVVEAPVEASNSMAFGARVVVEDAAGRQSYRIAGVDELDFEPDNISWISPIGKKLLAAELGQRLDIGDDKARIVRIVEVSY